MWALDPTEAPVDVEVLREEIRKTYADASSDEQKDFIFPTGRSSAHELGYPEPECVTACGGIATRTEAGSRPRAGYRLR
jgi:hypothetical protein